MSKEILILFQTALKYPMGNKIVWVNKDTVPHTATSGTSASDPTSGKIFDTKIITNGQSSPPQLLKAVKVGDSIPYYCQIHPYMTAKITVTAASSSSSSTSSNSSSSAAAGKRSRRCPSTQHLARSFYSRQSCIRSCHTHS